MRQFQVDSEVCIGCQECVKDCPFGLITMEDGVAVMRPELDEKCIGCQHCLAVCTTGAIGIMGKNPADSLAVPGHLPAADQLALLMKGRRSVRRYQPAAVSGQEIDFLLDAVAYAPTAVNNQQVLLTTIDDPGAMNDFRQEVYRSLEVKLAKGGLPPGMEYLEGHIRDSLATGQDSLFRNAPHLLIASAPQTSIAGPLDCHIALTYFELLAASMGLGALWSGLANWTLTNIVPELLPRLGIPDDHRLGYTMVFGRPAVQYPRTVQRQVRSNRRQSFK